MWLIALTQCLRLPAQLRDCCWQFVTEIQLLIESHCSLCSSVQLISTGNCSWTSWVSDVHRALVSLRSMLNTAWWRDVPYNIKLVLLDGDTCVSALSMQTQLRIVLQLQCNVGLSHAVHISGYSTEWSGQLWLGPTPGHLDRFDSIKQNVWNYAGMECLQDYRQQL